MLLDCLYFQHQCHPFEPKLHQILWKYHLGEALFQLLDQIQTTNEKTIVFANRRLLQQWLKEECQSRYKQPVSVINGAVNNSRKRMA